MKVPQVWPWLGAEEYAAIESCFTENWITEGPKAAEFREKLLAIIGAKHGDFAPNGTLALYLGLKAMGIGPGDEVIVPDFTFIASANAVVMAGATPVFVDVTRGNFQIDVSRCADVLTPRTWAIMPAHMYGMVSNMDAVMAFAREHNLKVIEDAAQALGVSYKGRHAGTFGDAGCFSFFADKTVTTGEGGFVVTDDENVHHNLLHLRNQGRPGRGTFVHSEIGFNFRMTDIQMAIGLVQLGKLEETRRRKLRALEWYKQYLVDVDEVGFLDLEPGSERIPFRACLLAERAHDLMEFMSEREIQPRTFFYPLHRQPCFDYLGESQDLSDERFPNANHGYEHGICLPVFPTLAEEQVKYVAGVIKDFYAGRS